MTDFNEYDFYFWSTWTNPRTPRMVTSKYMHMQMMINIGGMFIFAVVTR